MLIEDSMPVLDLSEGKRPDGFASVSQNRGPHTCDAFKSSRRRLLRNILGGIGAEGLNLSPYEHVMQCFGERGRQTQSVDAETRKPEAALASSIKDMLTFRLQG